MAMILVSLQSSLSQKGALGIFDPETGLRYLQIDTPSPIVNQSHPRGVVAIKNRIYVNTSASIRIYQLHERNYNPWLKLEKEVILNEWLLGDAMQADLTPMIASEAKCRLYVGNNNFFSVDEFDLDGTFIKRRHLWELAPDIFSPSNCSGTKFVYGYIRNLALSPNGTLYITVTNCINSGTGKVISFDTGEELISGLNDPCDGLIAGNNFFLHDIDEGHYLENKNSGKLYAYNVSQDSGTILNKFKWAARPEIKGDEYKNSIQNLRGMAFLKDTVFCGVSHFGKSVGPQIPPRIVAFDAASGQQKREYFLPDLEIFREPRVFFMTVLDEMFTVRWRDDLQFYYHEKPENPEYYHGEKEKGTEDAQSSETIVLKDKMAPLEVIGEVSVAEPEETKVPSIVLENIFLSYKRMGSFAFFSRNKHLGETKDFLAIDNVSLTIYENETVGIIGRNGSGKSTISMMITGVLSPDAGKVRIYGKVQLLALGVGFRQELTGRENVYVSGTLFGMTRKEITRKIDKIEEFAELGDFFEEPLRIYSSGMRSRLGFAVATAVNPDILILDEILSTGDAAFRNKADERMLAMRQRTKTVLMVSHNPAQLKKMCSRVVWLEKGQLIMDGTVDDVLPIYEEFCQAPRKWLNSNQSMLRSE